VLTRAFVSPRSAAVFLAFVRFTASQEARRFRFLILYPEPAMFDTFDTGPDGTLMLPEALPSGDYELYEVRAPRGYLLSDKPVKFTIHSSQ